MQMIIELLGFPSEDEIEIFSEIKDKELLKKFPVDKTLSQDAFEERFKDCSPVAVDLLKKMLTFDPTKRISVQDALNHPFLEELHCPEDEPTTDPVSAFDFDFEIYELQNTDYKDLLYEEIMLYHSEEVLKLYMDNKMNFPEGILSKKYGVQEKRPQMKDRKSSMALE